jgi:hypothetical protein|nr:hypothetical protein Q903MT_gene6031 [Picea sitchensis]
MARTNAIAMMSAINFEFVDDNKSIAVPARYRISAGIRILKRFSVNLAKEIRSYITFSQHSGIAT